MTARQFVESSADTEHQAENPRRPSSANSTAGALLALQSAAGNGAVSRMINVQREPADAAPELDSRALAVTMEPKLQAERAAALAEYEKTKADWVKLNALEEANDITAEGKAAKADIEKQQDAIYAKVKQADKDLLLLSTPGTSDQALNELMARRQQNVTVGATTDTSSTGYQVRAGGVSNTDRSVTSQVDGGKGTTTTTSSTTTIDSTGWSNKKTSGTSTVDGDKTTGQTTSTGRKVDVSGGGLDFSGGSSEKVESSGPAGSTSRTTGTSGSIGTSGYSSSTEDTRVNGSSVESDKSTSSFTRGDGKVGWSKSESAKRGTQDGDGAFIKGSETTNTSSAGAIAGRDGVGAYGSKGKSLSQTHEKGVKTGQTVGVDGKVVANVTQVPGSDPAKYQVSVSLSVGGKVGASGGFEHESGRQGAKASAGGSVSGALALSGTFVHVFDGDETQRYMASVTSGADAGPKELQIIKQLAHGNLSDAKALLNNVQASMMTAEGAAAMKEGDSSEISIDISGSVGVNGGGDMGGFGVKAGGGTSRGLKLKRGVARKGGKIVVSVAVDYSSGIDVGGSASMELANAGVQSKSTETSTESASFILDPDNHAYPRQFDTIKSANSLESLRHIAATNEDLLGAHSESQGSSMNTTVSAGVGPLGVEVGDTSRLDHSLSVDEHGQSTETWTGAKGGGLTLTGPVGMKVGHSEQGSVSATVGPDNKASGDLSKTTTDTDLGGSFDNLKKALSDNKLGLATGSAKIAAETSEVLGMKLSDADFAQIAEEAKYVDRWKKVEQGDDYSDWMKFRHTIVAADRDREKISKAMAAYGANHDGAVRALERIVRSVGTAQGGTLYDWPSELAGEKSSYTALIAGDPLTDVRTKRDAGNLPGAVEAANGVVAKIDAMVAGMQAKRDKFTDGAALGEMLAAAAARRGEIAREAATLSHQVKGVSHGSAELPAAGITTVPTAEQAALVEINQSSAKAELVGLQSALAELEKRQGKVFVFVQDELDDMYVDTDGIMRELNSLRDSVYPSWEKTLTQAREAAVRAGVDPWSIQPVPGKGFFNQLHKAAFGSTNDVYEWPPKPQG